MARERIDWRAVQSHHEQGHSIRECMRHFGFSYHAWDEAVLRGDVTPRLDRAKDHYRHETREAVKQLLEAGLTHSAIALELGLSKPTVSYHVRRLGVQRDERAALRFDWAQIQREHDAGMSRRELRAKYGFSTSAWYQAARRGVLVVQPREIPIEELLVAGRPRNRGHLRRRLVKAGLKEERCEECGLCEWRGTPLRVTLHHVNGDGYDNRLENLRFLCPNCHSQTPNFGGRNGHLRPRASSM